MPDDGNPSVEPEPSTQDSVPTGGMGDAARRIGELEGVVAHLVSHLARAYPTILEQDIIRKYLGLTAESDPQQALQRAKARLQPLSMMDCPNCDSKVRDMLGFTDERCTICGYLVGSER